MAKKTAYKYLQEARGSIILLLVGEEVDGLEGDKLKSLLEEVGKLATDGVRRFNERTYEGIIALAQWHLEEGQFDQAISKSREALAIKPKSRNAKRVIQVADSLEETRRLLAEKLPLGAEKAFRPANTSGLKLKIIIAIGSELSDAMNKHHDYEAAMGAARTALSEKDWTTAYQNAHLARNGWDDEAADALVEEIEEEQVAAETGGIQLDETPAAGDDTPVVPLPAQDQTSLNIWVEDREVRAGQTITIFVGGPPSQEVQVSCEWPGGLGTWKAPVLIDSMGDSEIQCNVPGAITEQAEVTFVASYGNVRAEATVTILPSLPGDGKVLVKTGYMGGEGDRTPVTVVVEDTTLDGDTPKAEVDTPHWTEDEPVVPPADPLQ